MTRARNLAGLGTVTAQPTTTTPVHLGPLGVGTFARIYGTWEHDQINSVSIGTTQLQISGITTGLNVSGIITAQNGLNITGNIVNGLNVTAGISTLQALTATTGTFTGDTTFSGAVSIAGTLTYEDVTAVDVVGVATFRSDLNIADKIVHTGDTNTAIRFPSADAFTVETGGSELVRVNTTNVTIKNTAAAWNKIQRAAATDYAGIAVQEADATQRMQFGVAGGSNQIVTGAAQHDVCLKAYDANLILATDATARLLITSTGRVRIGASTDEDIHTGEGADLQVVSTDAGGLTFARDDTTVSNGANLGVIRAYGNDNDGTYQEVASIQFQADKNHGTGDKPGRLVFSTTSDGQASVTERMRIDSSGNVGIGSAVPTGKVDIAPGGNAYFKFGQDSDNPKLEIFRSTGNASNTHYGAELQLLTGDFCYSNAPAADLGNHTFTERLRIDSSGRLLLGKTSGSFMLEVAAGSTDTLRITNTLESGHGSHDAKIVAGGSYYQNPNIVGSTIKFSTYNGSSEGERLRITSTGHMGLGVTPSPWATNADSLALQIGTGFSAFGRSTGDDDRGGIGVNNYNDGSANKYIANGHANRIYMNDGNIDFQYAGANSGGAGQTCTLSTTLRIDTSGSLLVGTTSDSAPDGFASLLQINSANHTGSLVVGRHTANANGPAILFQKSRSGSADPGVAVLSQGDSLGVIRWYGSDGSDRNSSAAQIACIVDGSPGGNDMPGELQFWTTSDGASSSSERMSINKNGQVLMHGTPADGHGLASGYGFYVLGLATSGSETDTGLSINAGNAGATSLIWTCRNTNNGTATQSSLYFMKWYYDGNNAPVATKIEGDSVTFGVSGSNTLTITGGAGNFRAAMIWIT